MSKIPTIAMIPSGYKANKVYSVLPTNGDADLDFSRTSEATRINQQGLVEEMATGIPRLDYSDGGCPSLLLEPASTNLIQYSEDFSDASWTIFDVTKEPNTIISPSGALNGCRVTAISGTNRVMQNFLTLTADPSNDRTFTGSLYIKSPNTTSCSLRVGASSSNNPITISSEWQRFDAQYVLGATFTAIRLAIVLNNENDIVDVAFGQVEEQSYATSYIPTSGATATRVAETLSKTGLSNYINSSEGVLYAEISAFEESGGFRIFGISDSTTNNRIIGYYFSSTNTIAFEVDLAGVDQLSGMSTVLSSALDFNKIAFKYKENDFSLWVNGVEVATDNSGSTFTSGTLNRLAFNDGGSGGKFYGKVKDLRVYKKALTDTELISLTS